ncbi:unnamed protein product [Owenia fusiformis]|uniref:Uncharacterized protein n=1 Tax=Owenia fusiformis TaxID=6347 RepID=A0A8S4PFN8_OWEFU|nr:unnamed protein product [Owenia fusiformis]
MKRAILCFILVIGTVFEQGESYYEPCFNLMFVFDVSCEVDKEAIYNALLFHEKLIWDLTINYENIPENFKEGAVLFDKNEKVIFEMGSIFHDFFIIWDKTDLRKTKCKPKTDVALRSLYEDHMRFESTPRSQNKRNVKAMAAILFTDGLTDSKSVNNIDNVLDDLVLYGVDLFTVLIDKKRKEKVKGLRSIVDKLQESNVQRYYDIKGDFEGSNYKFGANRFFDIRNESSTAVSEIANELRQRQPFPPMRHYGCDAPDLGFESEPHCWPWFAAIQSRDEYHPMGWVNFCGGSLLNNGWVLTSAHCFNRKRKDVRIVLGKHDLTKIEEGEVAYNISMIKIHRRNDIALVKLDGYDSNVISGKIQPAKLPAKNMKHELKDYVANKGKFTVIGYGVVTKSIFGRQSNVLREIEVLSQPLGQCKSTYSDKTTKRLFHLKNIRVTADSICAGGIGSDACKGDSGGPLMSNMTGEWLVYGLVESGAPACGLADIPGVYTSVIHNLKWIDSITGPIQNGGTNPKVYMAPNVCHRPVCVKELNVIIVADLTTDADISEYPIEAFIMQLGIAPTKVQLGIVAITDDVHEVITISREFGIYNIIEALRNVTQAKNINKNNPIRSTTNDETTPYTDESTKPLTTASPESQTFHEEMIIRAFKLADDQLKNNQRFGPQLLKGPLTAGDQNAAGSRDSVEENNVPSERDLCLNGTSLKKTVQYETCNP